MKIPYKFLSLLFKMDLVFLYFVNLILDAFDPVCPFDSLRLISYGGTGAALLFSILFKL